MSNPNNNKNFNDEALKINRALKKRIDKANAIVDNLIQYESENVSSNWNLRTSYERLLENPDDNEYKTLRRLDLFKLREILSWDVEPVTNS